MSEYSLERSFGIDDGELDALEKHECFVLGYELAQIDVILKSLSIGATRTIHSENRDRIQSYADKLGRKVHFSWMEADSSESWMSVQIEPPTSTEQGNG